METTSSNVLILRNDVNELSRVQLFLESLEEAGNVPSSLLMPLNLVLEEALTNIIFYAYEPGTVNEIRLDFVTYADRLEITLTDSGKPFDPTVSPDPDISLSAEDRPIGGLGIFLIRKLMDTVDYQRKNEQNILTLSKQLTS
ncbi:MAG TPA: ATP-binding protein [Bacteroidales bacterium]|jgi:anti-sigma regulatory factor (Ser/Thr protein kinase)|nr:MAG: Serine/threonine-protein kinase BtrW [Bacteroidetes bacterium ADurb.Bin416]HBL73398.1 ATP-binding protein [Bacteroidales bacterium]